MLFTLQIHPVLPDIRCNQNSLEWVWHIKYIGIIVDDKLSFKSHIADVCRRLNKIRGVLFQFMVF